MFLQAKDAAVQAERAKTLLNEAEPFYTERAWDKFVGKVSRGRAFASNAELQQRLSREVEFGKLASRADAAEADRKWPEAADQWQKAGDLFPARQWATMKAAVAWLLAGDVPAGVRALAVVAARSDADPAPQAKRMLDDLLKSFPTLEVEAAKARQGATRISTGEFETIKDEE